MTNLTVEVAFRQSAELGEGALWDEQQGVLYWVDIVENKVHRFDPSNRSNLSYDVGESVGTVVLSRDGRLLLGLRTGIAWLDPNTGQVVHLEDPERDKPHTRLNDGKCDPRGRFWVGSICEREPRFDGGLYCLDTDLTLTQKLTGIQCSNGLVWTSDERTFYYIDTPTHEIWGFAYDATTGNIGGKRVVAQIAAELGSPDGMTIDRDDHLWVALYHGHRVLRIDPTDGRIELEIQLPATNVTSVAFGGEQLDDLYITTARAGLNSELRAREPLAGSLFHARVPYQGVAANRFGRALGGA
jgi:sugar lactone lactonase YvrE